MFVLVGILIFIASFVIALVSLIREQKQIDSDQEKESAAKQEMAAVIPGDKGIQKTGQKSADSDALSRREATTRLEETLKVEMESQGGSGVGNIQEGAESEKRDGQDQVTETREPFLWEKKEQGEESPFDVSQTAGVAEDESTEDRSIPVLGKTLGNSQKAGEISVGDLKKARDIAKKARG